MAVRSHERDMSVKNALELRRRSIGWLTLGAENAQTDGMYRLILSLVGLVLLGGTGAQAELPPTQVTAARERWDAEIAKLKAKDEVEKHPSDAILFLGSSSVRLWDSIAEEMAPYHPIQRGYGGARFADLAVFAEELVRPHQFRAAVVFVGNDVTGKETDATVEQVVVWWQRVAAAVRAKQPQAAIFCVEITPTPSRWAAWEKIKEVNSALKKACEGAENTYFIETTAAYLDAMGQPRAGYFKKDMLHQNAEGYAVWSGLIKGALNEVLK